MLRIQNYIKRKPTQKSYHLKIFSGNNNFQHILQMSVCLKKNACEAVENFKYLNMIFF